MEDILMMTNFSEAPSKIKENFEIIAKLYMHSYVRSGRVTG